MDLKKMESKSPKYKTRKHLSCRAKDTQLEDATSSKDSMTYNEHGQSSSNYHQEQNCFGPPLIVEACAPDLRSLSIPDILQDEFQLRVDKTVPGHSETFDNYEYFRNNNTSIIVGQSINPKDSGNMQPGSVTIPESLSVLKTPKPTKRHKVTTSPGTSSDLRMSPNLRTQAQRVSKGDIKDAEANVMYSVQDMKQGTKQLSMSCDSIQTTHRSKHQKKLQFYTNGDSVILLMERDSKFYFCGKLIINVLFGVIEAHGSVITAQDPPTKVYHPRAYCFSPVEVAGKHLQCETDHIISLLLAEGIEPDVNSETQEIQLPCSNASAVLKLQNFNDHRTKFLSSLYGVRIFPKVESSTYYHWTDPRRAEIALQCNFYFYDPDAAAPTIVNPLVPVEITERVAYEWCTTGRSCTLLAGTKDVGKSAIARYLVNRLLPLSNKVVMVDLDIGQSEFTPSACISYTVTEKPLLGPSFTHTNMPTYQLYIGEVSIMKCISHYIEGVKKLMDHLLNSPALSNVPIVVNTMGFTQGIGWLLMVIIIKIVDPTTVIQITSKQAKKNFPKLLSSENINKENVTTISFRRSILDENKSCMYNVYGIRSEIEYLQRLESETWKMQPYEKRDLMTVCYFSDVLKEQIESASEIGSESPPALNAAIPYVTSLNTLCIAFPTPVVPPSQVLTAINGNIVALCGINLDNCTVLQNQDVESVAPTVLTRAPVSACYGFGIVRGIDTEKGEIYITTPVPHTIMRNVNCLQGCHQLPDILSQLTSTESAYTGGVNNLPTSREHRRGYFRMRFDKQQTSQ